MAPISIGITRREHKTPRDKYTRVYIDTKIQVEIWGSNLMLEDLEVDCVVKAWDVETGEETYSKTVAKQLSLPRNQSTEIVAMDVPASKEGEEGKTVVASYLIRNGKQIARYVNWPEPLKYLHLQKPKHLKAELSDDATSVAVSAEVPIKGLALECVDDEVKFEDNLVDIVPGETVTIAVTGAKKSSEIATRYLGMI
jgi:beta-mannosidase